MSKVVIARISKTGTVTRERGYNGTVFVTKKYTSGSSSQEVFDQNGLKSYTSYDSIGRATLRYDRVNLSCDVTARPQRDTPKTPPRLAGPKGPLPR